MAYGPTKRNPPTIRQLVTVRRDEHSVILAHQWCATFDLATAAADDFAKHYDPNEYEIAITEYAPRDGANREILGQLKPLI